jgi:RimJ/RimL family protein N-acetyltransferase
VTDRLPTLVGDRVQLRWLTHEDSDALFDVFGDPEVVRYWSSPALEGRSAATALVDEIHEYRRAGSLFQWGVARSDDDFVIGTCTLASIDRQHQRAEIGFALRRDAWGQGLAAEALDLLIRHAFDEMGLHRLEADVDPENTSSLRLLSRRGFRDEGRMRQRWRHSGQWRDSVMLALLAPEWRARDAQS